MKQGNYFQFSFTEKQFSFPLESKLKVGWFQFHSWWISANKTTLNVEFYIQQGRSIQRIVDKFCVPILNVLISETAKPQNTVSTDFSLVGIYKHSRDVINILYIVIWNGGGKIRNAECKLGTTSPRKQQNDYLKCMLLAARKSAKISWRKMQVH